MSRSYKKTPYSGCPKQKFFKNYANRIIRRRPVDEFIEDGGRYKRYLCSWSICDYGGRGPTWEEAKQEYLRDGRGDYGFYPFNAEWLAHKEGRPCTMDDVYREYHVRYRAK